MYPYTYQNPYVSNFQPPYAQNIGHNIAGRYVNTFDEVSANDVPMDGSYATFIKNDMSEIQLRKWNANGSIDKTSYKPFYEPFTPSTVNSQSDNQKAVEIDVKGQLDLIVKQLNELSDKINHFQNPLPSEKVTRKVSEENE